MIILRFPAFQPVLLRCMSAVEQILVVEIGTNHLDNFFNLSRVSPLEQ